MKYIFSITLIFFVFQLFAQPEEGAVEVANLEILNSEQIDFSPVPYKNGVVFTSNRGTGKLLDCVDDDPEPYYSDLFFAEKEMGGSFKNPVPFKRNINKKYHDGVATFNVAGDLMVFSRNSMKGKNSKDIIDVNLYTAEWKDGNWVNVSELPFNDPEITTCHPTLSKDGKRLYFSSNLPGGQGGMDLYVVHKTADSWSEPMNLGQGVNSTGNELFPFIDTEDNLFFSSNGKGGLGGLDIFRAERETVSNETTWKTMNPMDAPFNSAYDDFAFSIDVKNTEGYFSSDREGGAGKDDIYSWKFTPKILDVIVGAEDAATSERLSGATATVQPVFSNQSFWAVLAAPNMDVSTHSTDLSGEFEYTVFPSCEYTIKVEKEGYLPKEISVSASALEVTQPYIIPLDKEKVMIRMSGVVVNANDNSPLPGAKREVRNSCTGEKHIITLDAKGRFEEEIECGCNYDLVAGKEKYEKSETLLTTDCNPARDVTATLKLKPLMKIIAIENIFYDFDRYNIRQDASSDLDHLVELLKKYPSMEIEMGAHTDSRGTKTYNVWLAKERVDSAVKYIISQGIDGNRLIAKSYGEVQLVNHCSDGVSCSKEEHQANRRTEIKVTKLEEENVKVEYK